MTHYDQIEFLKFADFIARLAFNIEELTVL